MEIRPYTDRDFDSYLRLRNELDRFGQVVTAAEFRASFDFPNVDPGRDIFFVVERDAPVGFGRLYLNPEKKLNRHWFHLRLPERLQGETSLLADLIAECEGRLRRAAAAYEGPLQLRASCYDVERWYAAAFERGGYEFIRYFARMDLRDLAVEPAVVPAEVTLRRFDRSREAAAFVAAFNRGFEGHFEFYPQTLEQFEMFFDSLWFQADKAFVAEAGGEIVGLDLNRLEAEPQADGFAWGLVQQLAVVPAWRGKGLGRALLRRGLETLREAGAERAYLGVDYANPFGAKDLYYGEGFVDRYVSRAYAKDEAGGERKSAVG
jgi:predicted N-acetyltransferase YhbS